MTAGLETQERVSLTMRIADFIADNFPIGPQQLGDQEVEIVRMVGGIEARSEFREAVDTLRDKRTLADPCASGASSWMAA